jgi:hypothetical protein
MSLQPIGGHGERRTRRRIEARRLRRRLPNFLTIETLVPECRVPPTCTTPCVHSQRITRLADCRRRKYLLFQAYSCSIRKSAECRHHQLAIYVRIYLALLNKTKVSFCGSQTGPSSASRAARFASAC